MSVLVLRALVLGAAARGIDPPTLAARAAIPPILVSPASLADPDGRVPAAHVLRVWEYLPAALGDECFGLGLAQLAQGAPLSVGWWVVWSSPTLRDGLAQAIRYQRLLHDQARSELVWTQREGIYRHQVGARPERAPRHAIEFGFAQVVHLMRRASGRPLTPAWVEFQHAPPAERSQHQRLFGQEIRFNASGDRIHFDRATCELPSLQADPALGELVAAHARALLARLPKDASVAAQVRRALAGELPNKLLTVETVATRLSLSKRTLQRRLRDEGTSFDEIIDELRRHLSERYLAEQGFSVQETAFLLGFSDVSAFHRAFSRWTGRSPARFRLDS